MLTWIASFDNLGYTRQKLSISTEYAMVFHCRRYTIDDIIISSENF